MKDLRVKTMLQWKIGNLVLSALGGQLTGQGRAPGLGVGAEARLGHQHRGRAHQETRDALRKELDQIRSSDSFPYFKDHGHKILTFS